MTRPTLPTAALAVVLGLALTGCSGSSVGIASPSPTPTAAQELPSPTPSATPSAAPSPSASATSALPSASSAAPARDVPATAKSFFDALVAGDRAGVAAVAVPEVVAQFEPYDPIARDEDLESPRYTLNGDQLSMLLQPTVTVLCTVTPGSVVTCAFGE